MAEAVVIPCDFRYIASELHLAPGKLYPQKCRSRNAFPTIENPWKFLNVIFLRQEHHYSLPRKVVSSFVPSKHNHGF